MSIKRYSRGRYTGSKTNRVKRRSSSFLRGILLVGVFALGVLYIYQTSTVSVKGYDLGDLQKSVSELEREERKLQAEIATYRSLDNVESRLAEMNMETVKDAEYVAPIGTTVAKR